MSTDMIETIKMFSAACVYLHRRQTWGCRLETWSIRPLYKFTYNDTYSSTFAIRAPPSIALNPWITVLINIDDGFSSRHDHEVVSSVRRPVNGSVSFLCRSVIDFRTCPRPTVSRRRNSCQSTADLRDRDAKCTTVPPTSFDFCDVVF